MCGYLACRAHQAVVSIHGPRLHVERIQRALLATLHARLIGVGAKRAILTPRGGGSIGSQRAGSAADRLVVRTLMRPWGHSCTARPFLVAVPTGAAKVAVRACPSPGTPRFVVHEQDGRLKIKGDRVHAHHMQAVAKDRDVGVLDVHGVGLSPSQRVSQLLVHKVRAVPAAQSQITQVETLNASGGKEVAVPFDRIDRKRSREPPCTVVLFGAAAGRVLQQLRREGIEREQARVHHRIHPRFRSSYATECTQPSENGMRSYVTLCCNDPDGNVQVDADHFVVRKQPCRRLNQEGFEKRETKETWVSPDTTVSWRK